MGGRKPLEQKRVTARSATKDSAGRPLPDPSNVRVLPGAGKHKPPAPSHLGDAGTERWVRLWAAAEWLAPLTDYDLLVRLCEAEDLRTGMKEALAEEGFYVAGSMGQKRPNPLLDKLRALDDQITKYEMQCGLTPAARGALHVGEVEGDGKGKSSLDLLLERAANRNNGTTG